jgi:hypothetical protein
MTMKPPAFADALVSGLSASPATANEILGDLAEEWQEHVDQDGPANAKRWYWGQALRAIPHLIQQWKRESPWTVVVGVVVVAVVARVLVALAGAVATAALYHSASYDGWQTSPIRPWRVVFMLGVGVATLMNFGVGALIAFLMRRAPLMVIGWMWVLYMATDVSFGILPSLDHPVIAVVGWFISNAAAALMMVAGALVVLRRRERARSAA